MRVPRWKTGLGGVLLGVLLLAGVAAAPLPRSTRAPGAGEAQGARVAEIAALLEMTPRALGDAWRAGRSVRELAAEREISYDELFDSLAERHRSRRAEQVALGLLNSEQAAYLAGRADERLDDLLTATPRQAPRLARLRLLAQIVDAPPAEVEEALAAGDRPADLLDRYGLTAGEAVARGVAIREEALAEQVALDLMTVTRQRLALDRIERSLQRAFERAD